MSLHQLAHHVQSAGRGDDKVLVHMTPGEVKGLQSLAMAHGGSLTINPQTGLPEAGFLSSLLPMFAGLALGPAGLGLTAMQAGLATAAIGTAATGSLGRGLMMGLGAYGGAGLGAGLQSMGTPSVMTPAIPNAGAVTAPTSVFGGTSPLANVGAVDITASPLANLPVNTASSTPLAFKSALPSPATAPISPAFDITKSMSAAGMPTGVTTAPPPVVAPPPAPVAAPAPPPAPAPSAQAFNVDPRMGGYAQSAVPPTREMAMATTPPPSAFSERIAQMGRGLKASTSSLDGLKALYSASEAAAPYSGVASLGSTAMSRYYDQLDEAKKRQGKSDTGMIRPYEFSREVNQGAFDVGAPIYSATPGSSAERRYFEDEYTALAPYKAPGAEYAAKGGVMGLAVGGPVEQMAAMNSVGANTGYPMAQLQTPLYSNPAVQRPEAVNVISPSAEPAVGMYTGEQKFAGGGISHLGDYSDGGRLLKGPGDGVSDSIPAVIGDRQPARLADGEFVVPARIVSELGNGSTEAGARKLYAMMDRVQKARRKTVGKNRVAANTRSEKYLPA